MLDNGSQLWMTAWLDCASRHEWKMQLNSISPHCFLFFCVTTRENASNKGHSVIPQSLVKRSRPTSVWSVENKIPVACLALNLSKRSVIRACGTNRATRTTTKSFPITVNADCEQSDAEAQANRERIRKQCRILQKGKWLKERKQEDCSIAKHPSSRGHGGKHLTLPNVVLGCRKPRPILGWNGLINRRLYRLDTV